MIKSEFDTSYRVDNYGVGMMGTDWGERIDFSRMRQDRLQKAKDAIAARWENVRYLTGHRTHMWPVMWWGLTQSVLLRGAPNALLYTMDEEHIATYSKDDPIELKNGMVFSIEPFAGKRGVGGVRLEENVVVRPDRPEILSKFPFEEACSIRSFRLQGMVQHLGALLTIPSGLLPCAQAL